MVVQARRSRAKSLEQGETDPAPASTTATSRPPPNKTIKTTPRRRQATGSDSFEDSGAHLTKEKESINEIASKTQHNKSDSHDASSNINVIDNNGGKLTKEEKDACETNETNDRRLKEDSPPAVDVASDKNENDLSNEKEKSTTDKEEAPSRGAHDRVDSGPGTEEAVAQATNNHGPRVCQQEADVTVKDIVEKESSGVDDDNAPNITNDHVKDKADEETRPTGFVPTNSYSPPTDKTDGAPGKFAFRTRRRAHQSKKSKNGLTQLIPGYTAPMKLLTTGSESLTSNSGGMSAGSLEDIRRKALREDNRSQQLFKSAHVMAQLSTTGSLSTSYKDSHAAFYKKKRKRLDQSVTTAGSGWFNMKTMPMTEDLQRDMSLIRNRNYLDPKKFYKSTDSKRSGANLFVQQGTVIEGPTEYYSSRLTKKQRKSNLVDEIMAEPDSSRWAQQKYKKMQQDKAKASRQWGKQISNRGDYKKSSKR